MNKLSKIILAWFAFGLFTVANAACQPLVNHYTDQFMLMLEGKVELSSEQQNTLRETLKESINAREDVIESFRGQSGIKAKKALKTELDSVNANLQARAQEILDADQYNAFLEVQEETKKDVKERVNKMM